MTALTIDQVLALRSDISAADLAEIKDRASALLPLAAIRERAGITQSKMASLLGKSQAAVSKFEGRGDFLLSTLYRHVSAIGWDLAISISSNGTCFDLVPSDMGDDVAFSLAEGKKESAHFLSAHARQYSALKNSPRPKHFKQWARPIHRTPFDRALNRVIGEPA